MRGGLLALLMLACAAAPAQAALSLCNRTSYILYAATSGGAPSQTRGWSRIVPGECAVVRGEKLAGPRYLVFARSGPGHSGPERAWGGANGVCVKDGDFNLRQVPGTACNGGAYTLPFAVLTTSGKPDAKMSLDETPAYPSLIAAQLAGLKRLLSDNGYRIGVINGAPDKETGAALADFRKRVRLPPGAGNSQLFQALETEAARRLRQTEMSK